ncbi:hypothetical protein [Pseudomonas sp. NPDC087336]|uniref:hypothetical protein n=1 Tax=Pseudomonas sp. NPDC087336 TaxID=3364436 RepID=UPI0037F5EAA9
MVQPLWIVLIVLSGLLATCGSGLARDDIGMININSDDAAAIAGKPAPTGLFIYR